MDSKTLNSRISELDATPLADECAYGKPIFYIGWFWREVDFDAEQCELGIIPRGADGNSKQLVGFMENNKWGYPSVYVTGEPWENIKKLIAAAVENPTKETCEAVNEAMEQATR